jgi:hypothetical protein
VAPVLVCPECSTKHPLGEVADRTAFPCTGCGRQLKVPEAAVAKQTVPPTRAPMPDAPPPDAPQPAASPPPPRRRPTPEPETLVLPAVDAAPAPPVVVTAPPPLPVADEKPARDPIPPRWVRFALWFVAIPLAFAVVLAFARGFGMLTSNQIQDLALAEGIGRFWPIVRLLPFVAFAAAIFVQGGTWGIAKLRERQWAEQAKHAGTPKSNGTRPRPKSKQQPPRRPQSTRTRA